MLTFYWRPVKLQIFVTNSDGFGNMINLEKIGKIDTIFERI